MPWQPRQSQPWVIVPCLHDAQVIRDLTLMNAGAKVGSKRQSINEFIAKGRSFYEYVFYTHKMKTPLFCTYDDGTCERFESPYTDFPLVRTTALPTHVLFGMQWETSIMSEMQRPLYAHGHLYLVTDIYRLWELSFPRKFCWGPARKSFLHPRSIDSYCDGDRLESCRNSSGCTVDNGDSAIYYHAAHSVSNSDCGTTDGAVEPIDIVRIDAWRRQVVDHAIACMPDLEAPPMTVADTTAATRRLDYTPMWPGPIGRSYDVDTSRFTSNDWAFHKFDVPIWVVGANSKQAQRKLRAAKRARRRHYARLCATVAPMVPNEGAPYICASPERQDSTDCVDGRITSGLDVDDVANSGNAKQLLDRNALSRIRLSQVQVSSRKRRRDFEDITRIERPRKRASCHW
ncbi:hypothetical protein FISHEDRAFT_75608 [Fistulina hepatica ATCC 64428]|uniref:Uncharacterized protein n=1 Tax=Fistulina hepatica ATCC 64428 TaxID=1128425 RepID=A0A0D7A643_9AGAR|nr:hypothetical protein FISHEDRAFT_75606 [Fistulina hepatica ATCC 64428]KIY46482.1 hypothetical protein FISHEDRAFT_75608 [Fistulina hepatica ATCC 64428]